MFEKLKKNIMYGFIVASVIISIIITLKTISKYSKEIYNKLSDVLKYFNNSNMEGGQTNIMRRLPKIGFNNKGIIEPFAYINLGNLIYYINKGKI
jgi:hypothetical protein